MEVENRRGNLAGIVLGAFLLILACSSDSPTTVLPGATPVPVTFRYVPPVPADTPTPEGPAYTGCVHHYSAFGGSFVLEGSWSPNAHFPHLDCSPECGVLVPDVPVDEEHVVFMRDLKFCKLNPSEPPVSYENLWANGVLLSRVVNHPSGMRGLAFTVTRDGTVIR